MSFQRITVDPAQMDGISCIRGLRIPVSTVVDMAASGMNEGDILAAFPDLEQEDIHAALRYAAAAVRERQLSQVANWNSFSSSQYKQTISYFVALAYVSSPGRSSHCHRC
jgi:uncharacterized protein (DUF433 family)